MHNLHNHVTDMPQLRGNAFYKCTSCMHAKSRQRSHNIHDITQKMPQTNTDALAEPTTQCGQHFQIDFGFMRGSQFSETDQQGCTITSIDGYRSYCLIIDKRSHYT
jgi:hypothetical protein